MFGYHVTIILSEGQGQKMPYEEARNFYKDDNLLATGCVRAEDLP